MWAGRADARTALLQQVVSEPGAVPHASAVTQLMSLLHPPDSSSSSSASSASSASVSSALDPSALLTGYLQSSEGCTPTDQRLAFLTRAVAQLEGPAAVGASFPALLGPLLQLGLLSSRQVHATTLAVEAARWGGRLPPLLGPSTPTAKAALSAVELSDFHRWVAV